MATNKNKRLSVVIDMMELPRAASIEATAPDRDTHRSPLSLPIRATFDDVGVSEGTVERSRSGCSPEEANVSSPSYFALFNTNSNGIPKASPDILIWSEARTPL